MGKLIEAIIANLIHGHLVNNELGIHSMALQEDVERGLFYYIAQPSLFCQSIFHSIFKDRSGKNFFLHFCIILGIKCHIIICADVISCIFICTCNINSQ